MSEEMEDKEKAAEIMTYVIKYSGTVENIVFSDWTSGLIHYKKGSSLAGVVAVIF